jgi:hypothetical protein
MKDRVVCYAGSVYPEHPRLVIWEGQQYTVEKIHQRRRTPEGIGFLVQCSSDKLFDLFYLTLEDCWRIQPK